VALPQLPCTHHTLGSLMESWLLHFAPHFTRTEAGPAGNVDGTVAMIDALDRASGGSIAWLPLLLLLFSSTSHGASMPEPLMTIVSFRWTTAETQLRYTAAAAAI
jgi:hypothetical protein